MKVFNSNFKNVCRKKIKVKKKQCASTSPSPIDYYNFLKFS